MKRKGSFRSTPTMKLKRLLIRESGTPTNRIVLFSLILSKVGSFSSTLKTDRLMVAGPISVLDLLKGTPYKSMSSDFRILLLFLISISAKRTSPTFKVADFELSLLCIVSLSADTRFGNDGPADSSSV